MIPPPPGRSLSARPPWRTALFLAALLGGFAAGTAPVRAQNVGTVRDNEFRSRWADYQVDRPQQTTNAPQDAANAAATTQTEQAGLLAAFGKSFDELFRDGPLQVRANLATGWEFSDEDNLRQFNPHGSDNSFFAAPALGVFYNQERGPLTISARYSAGYVYYLDQNYLAANHDGGILSQTAGLDLGLDGKRVNFSSHTNASYGNGNDIESGQLRNLLDLGEDLGGTYQLTEFTQLGATASVGYQKYSGGTLPETATTTDSGSVYGDYVITGKTRLRFELDAGQQLQDTTSVNAATSSRYYYQAIVSANYVPAPKLTFDAGLGYGFQNDSDLVGRGNTGSHPVYRLTITYTPTPKTLASFHFGYEGVDVEPDINLNAQWQFRVNTSATLSIYQNSNFSTYEIGQNVVTRGALVSGQQRVFGRVDISLSGGVEQSSGYNTALTPRPSSNDPYFFGGITLLYELNSYLALQGYYRGFTGEAGAVVIEKGLQSRAAVSLRLTF